MKIRVLIYIVLIALGLLSASSVAWAQFPNARPNDRFGNYGNNVTGQDIRNSAIANAEQGLIRDSSKIDTTKRKPRKPLESFFFDDSLRATRIFAWNVNPMFNTISRTPVDTLMELFQLDYKFMRQDIGAASLGNVGGATIPLNYFRRPDWKNFSFVQAWSEYIMTPEKAMFYNAKIPYSRLNFEMSGQTKLEENLFSFVLSHNVSPSTSVNVIYNADATKGMYQHQKTLARYVALNVAHTGKRYAIHGGYIYNHGDINENGGVRDDREITDTVLASADQVEVNLKDSRNVYRSHTFWYTQSYGIPLRRQREDELTIQKIPSIYIGQSFDYTLFKRVYEARNDTALYKTSYIDPVYTYDSMSQQVISIKAFAQLQPYNRDGALGLVSAGFGTDIAAFYNRPVPEQMREQYGRGGRNDLVSTYLYGSLQGKVSKYMEWSADAKYYLFGYRSQDLSIGGALRLSAYIKQKPLTLDVSARYSLTTPDYWAENYFSNHIAWSNAFNKESAMLFAAKFSIPSINLYLGGDYKVSNGTIYYNAASVATQYSDPLSVLGIYLQKDFRVGGFHFNHRVLAQFSSNQEVAPVPLISAFLSYYFEFNVKKDVLRMQIGVDCRYNTKYYAFAYNPALAQFYNQREKELGGYPYLDAFVNAKWKRMRILLKLQHWNANLFGEKNYFQVLHHPQNRMMFKIGVSWSFYD